MRRPIILAAAAAAATALLLSGPVDAQSLGGDSTTERSQSSARVCRPGGMGKGTLRVLGVTADQRLVCFAENNPTTLSLGAIAGLTGDTSLVGIDFRPATGELFGLGNAGGLYVVNPANGAATFKAQLSVALSGTSFGVDFNPTVDRLRIISDTGQNLRVVPDTGVATVDGSLNDGAPAPVVLAGITGAAYTNNDLDASTGTTLFDVDTTLNRLAIQGPPNAGNQLPTGALRVDPDAPTGFDIYSSVSGGVTIGNRALASLSVGGSAGLYRIDPLTGTASLVGAFAAGDQLVGLAIPLNQG